MSRHQTQDHMESAHFDLPIKAFYSQAADGHLLGFGTTVPSAVAGWSPGAIFVDVNAAAGQQLWTNEGTALSCSFKRQEAGNVELLDSETIVLGTGTDATLQWNGTDLLLSYGTDDDGIFKFGDGTKDKDVQVFLGTASEYVLFDVGNSRLDSQVKCRIGTHDWGTGATGILLDGTDDDMVLIAAGRINSALATGAYASSYNQLASTAAQTGNVSQFASWNELYFTGTTAIGTGNAGAVWGHIEISGTFTGPASTSNYMGAVIGTLMSDANTVTNTGMMGAFVADSVLTSGFTDNGVIAAFLAHVNDSHPTRAAWPYGLYVQAGGASTAGAYIGSGATRALDAQGKGRFGTHDWGTGATGTLLDGTDPDMAFEVAARITSALASSAYAASYSQLACTAAQTGNVSTFANWNELYFTGTTAIGTGNAASVWAHIEISGTFTGPVGASNYMGSVVGSLMSDAATVTNAGIMGAFVADSVLTTGFTNNGVIAAFVAHVNASHPTRANWPIALYIDGADVAFGFGSATNYEDGIKAVAATPAGNTTHAIKIDIGGVAGYIPVYAAETF